MIYVYQNIVKEILNNVKGGTLQLMINKLIITAIFKIKTTCCLRVPTYETKACKTLYVRKVAINVVLLVNSDKLKCIAH